MWIKCLVGNIEIWVQELLCVLLSHWTLPLKSIHNMSSYRLLFVKSTCQAVFRCTALVLTFRCGSSQPGRRNGKLSLSQRAKRPRVLLLPCHYRTHAMFLLLAVGVFFRNALVLWGSDQPWGRMAVDRLSAPNLITSPASPLAAVWWREYPTRSYIKHTFLFHTRWSLSQLSCSLASISSLLAESKRTGGEKNSVTCFSSLFFFYFFVFIDRSVRFT